MYDRIEKRDGCLIWTGARNTHGYGAVWRDGKVKAVHRVAWEDKNGPIPPGMTIHHVCHERLCADTDHMVLMSKQEHGRLDSPPRSHCSRGHSMDDAYESGGQRWCRECKKETERRRWNSGKKVVRGKRKRM